MSESGKIENGELPKEYWLKGSNAPSYLENYKAHRAK
jgi:hypothetical protein